jgi:hypothetical protein
MQARDRQDVPASNQPPTPAVTESEFWVRWSPWRPGEPGQGNFADVLKVLGTYEIIAQGVARQLVGAKEEVTILDLACGAATMAGPLVRAIEDRGGIVHRYVGVDYADPRWMKLRVAQELMTNKLLGRGEYILHDLSTGLPAGIASRLGVRGRLLIASCWGICYLGYAPLVALLKQCVALAAQRKDGALLYITTPTLGRLDRDVLTRRFLREIVPYHVWTAVRHRAIQPLREIALALRALPKLRQFSDEITDIAGVMPAGEVLDALREVGLDSVKIDETVLWGQMTSITVRLAGSEAVAGEVLPEPEECLTPASPAAPRAKVDPSC